MKQLKLLNPENASEDEVKNYATREAARAVVMDAEGKIALLYVSKHNYYKLPGGGIEEGEDAILGLKRECQEEIGCDIEVVGEVGVIIEYKKSSNLKQTSYCYLARVVGEKGSSNFSGGEVEDGFRQVWLSYSEAKKALVDSKATSFAGSNYIVPRDIIFLEETGGLLSLKGNL